MFRDCRNKVAVDAWVPNFLWRWMSVLGMQWLEGCVVGTRGRRSELRAGAAGLAALSHLLQSYLSLWKEGQCHWAVGVYLAGGGGGPRREEGRVRARVPFTSRDDGGSAPTSASTGSGCINKETYKTH